MKVTILGGGGGVGASVAFNLLMLGGNHEVVLVDQRPEMVTSHVMDLEQTLTLGARGLVRAGDESDLADADVVVMAASVPLRANMTRHVFLEENAPILEELVAALPEGWEGTLLVATNPVDPLVTLAQSLSGLDRRRVLGYCINDSLRLRSGIAAALGVAPQEVEAWVVGEHGDECAPLFDRIRVKGVEVDLGAAERAAAEEFLRSWYRRHVGLNSGRTSTWTSGLGVARMVAALGAAGDELWTASVVLAGEYGISGVALSVPVTLGGGSVRAVREWELGSGPAETMRRAAALVREAVDGVSSRAAGERG